VYDGLCDPRSVLDGLDSDDATTSVLHDDRFEMTVYRRPVAGARPAIGLTAAWDTDDAPVVLAEVRER